RARLADSGEGPFLRTGDLGFLVDGELFVTGRLTDLLIIHGQNHYPQDIERTVERSHPALRPDCGAAFLVGPDVDEQLVVAQEIERHHEPINEAEVFSAIRSAAAEEHGLFLSAIVLLKTGGLPKTSSGKVRRRACREAYLGGTLPVLHASQSDARGTS